MVKILIIAHGPLAEAFKESAKMFFGEAAEAIEAIGLFPADSPESLKEKIEQKITEMDDGSGVLIFVDIFAGTTFNMAALSIEEMKQDHKIESYSGVNMPLLIEVLPNCSTSTLEQLKNDVASIAPDTIVNLRTALDI